MTKRTHFSIGLLYEIFRDPDRKQIIRIIREMFYLALYHRTFPRHYFSRYLFKKGNSNIKDYFPSKVFKKIKSILNDKEVIEVVENKLYFDFFYSQFNISLPEILMYNHKNLFVFDNNSFMVQNAVDFNIQLGKLFKKKSSIDSIIIKRTYWSHGGDKIYKVFKDELTNNQEKITKIYLDVIKSGFLFQKTVKQHSELNRLNPSCLNTIRFDTFIDKNGKIEIISGVIRMSGNNSHVDNVSSGGFGVGIDIESGVLKKEGYSGKFTPGVKLLTSHPITNVVFEDFNIPYFNEAKELVIRAASFMPGLRIVGWDVAIGESGPVLIEGNSNYGMEGPDLVMGGYGSSAVFRKILSEIKRCMPST